MVNREQLACTAGSHKIVHLFLRRGELIESLHGNHYHGQRIQSFGSVAKELPLVRVVEDSHSCTRIFSKKLPVNLPPAAFGFVGFRSTPTGIVILSFIEHQCIDSWLKLPIACDVAHKTRNDFTEVEFTLGRASSFIPSYAGCMEEFTGHTFSRQGEPSRFAGF
jgi:hypothetical protein